MCMASEEMMNKFDGFNASVASDDEDTVILSTDFENFYPSFDVPVVAELAAHELLSSGLTLEVDSIEISLYISIYYEREGEDLVWPGVTDRRIRDSHPSLETWPKT